MPLQTRWGGGGLKREVGAAGWRKRKISVTARNLKLIIYFYCLLPVIIYSILMYQSTQFYNKQINF
jgi:hypothetical protein